MDDQAPEFDEDGCIVCPYCQTSYMHQGIVQVFDRSEDSSECRRTTVGEKVSVDNLGSQNPSSRRQGARIRFWCEGCPHKYWLNVYQHKGRTFLSWTVASAGSDEDYNRTTLPSSGTPHEHNQ